MSPTGANWFYRLTRCCWKSHFASTDATISLRISPNFRLLVVSSAFAKYSQYRDMQDAYTQTKAKQWRLEVQLLFTAAFIVALLSGAEGQTPHQAEVAREISRTQRPAP